MEDLFKKKTMTSKNINKIWVLEDEDEIIIELHAYLCEKCEYGELFNKLTSAEKTIYLCQELEGEVNNGGFDQFFFNSSGDFTMETLSALRDIGAKKTYELLERAISLFPDKYVPQDRTKRQNILLKRVKVKKFDKLDDAFYEYQDNLMELNYCFVMKHKSEFI